jgi:hypothetical protein
MPFVSILRRIFGWPNITIKYRGHWRVMMNAHPDILRLIDDTPDGETYRCAIAEWSHSERPVIDYFRGISSSFRIEGPWHEAGNTLFPMGSLIRSPGVTAHLDPIETVAVEVRMRAAIENEILRWIEERDAHAFPPVPVSLERKSADPKAVAHIEKWLADCRAENPAEGGSSHA